MYPIDSDYPAATIRRRPGNELTHLLMAIFALRAAIILSMSSSDPEDEFDVDGDEYDIDGDEFDVDIDEVGINDELFDEDDPADD